MKKTCQLVMLALLVTTLFACKKDKGDNDLKKDLISFWELAEASSSWVPQQTYAPGNGNILRINYDGSYIYYTNGQATEQGNYTIIEDNTVENEVCLVNLKDKYKNRFDVTNVSPARPVSFKTFFYIENDKLYMIGGCYAIDAGSLRVYRRSNPRPID